MRSHFAQILPFAPKDNDLEQNISDQLLKVNNCSGDETSKKSSFYADLSTLKTQLTSSYKTYISKPDQDQKQTTSSRNNQNTNKPTKYNPFSGKQKKTQPPKIQRSPPKPNIAHSPNSFQQSKTIKEVPLRTTLKTLIQTKGLTSLDRSLKNQSRVQSPKMKLSSSITESRCQEEDETVWSKSMKLLQKENQILREQNDLLKCQMNQIKKHIMSLNTFKKQEAISNLRDTIKKEDNQIKELRTKLQISNKKVTTLNSLLQNKDEEIQFLNNKIAKLEEEILELRDQNNEAIQDLKEKMGNVLKGYSELQQKYISGQQEWAVFTEKWMQQKSMYTHRINFLQTYISNNN